jgi:hypothetical protein
MGVQDRVENMEQDASDKVDKLRFATNIDALNRIMTDDGPNITMISVAIFEADLPSELYAYRPGRNAQQAVVEVEEQLFRGRPEVVHADLADYVGSIPHAGGTRLIEIDVEGHEKWFDPRLVAT